MPHWPNYFRGKLKTAREYHKISKDHLHSGRLERLIHQKDDSRCIAASQCNGQGAPPVILCPKGRQPWGLPEAVLFLVLRCGRTPKKKAPLKVAAAKNPQGNDERGLRAISLVLDTADELCYRALCRGQISSTPSTCQYPSLPQTPFWNSCRSSMASSVLGVYWCMGLASLPTAAVSSEPHFQ